MTTEQQTRRAAPALMVFPFPMPGDQVRLAYRELHIAINGTEEEKKALGNHALLPRPWEPALRRRRRRPRQLHPSWRAPSPHPRHEGGRSRQRVRWQRLCIG